MYIYIHTYQSWNFSLSAVVWILLCPPVVLQRILPRKKSKKQHASAFLNGLLFSLHFLKMYCLDKISPQKPEGISRNHHSEPFLIKKYTERSFATEQLLVIGKLLCLDRIMKKLAMSFLNIVRRENLSYKILHNPKHNPYYLDIQFFITKM